MRSALAPVVVFLAACALYLPRTAISPQDGDGAELALAALTGGTIHPPGYPLYAALTRAAVALFPENPYAVLANFSAICQAGAAALLALVAIRAGAGAAAAASVGGAWLLFEPTVRTATDAELFALHHLLALGAVLAALEYGRRPRARAALVFGAICGAAAAHHHAIVLWTPLFAAALLAGESRAAAVGGAVRFTAAAIGAAGSLYALLLVLPHPPAHAPFGAVRTFEDLARYLFRLDYGTFALKAAGGAEERAYLADFLRLMTGTLPFLLLAPVLQLMFKAGGASVTAGVLGSVLLHLLFLTGIRLPADETLFGEWAMRFFALAALPFAAAAAFVIGSLGSRRERALAAVLLLVPALIHAPRALSAGDARADEVIRVELREILRELPRGAVIFARLDRHAMGLALLRAMGVRPDVIPIVTGLLSHTGYRESIREAHPELFEPIPEEELTVADLTRRMSASGRFVGGLELVPVPSGFRAYPHGLVWEWVPEDETVPLGAVYARLSAFCERLPAELGEPRPQRTLTGTVIPEYFRHAPRSFAPQLPDEERKELLERCR